MDELLHYGTKRHSGRWPWGSGENPYQHEPFFRKTYLDLKEQGLTDKDIMDSMGMSSTEFRAMKQISKAARQQEEFRKIRELKDKGLSNAEIGKRLDPPRGESYVRNMMDEAYQIRTGKTQNVANILKAELEKKGMIDVGKGNDVGIGVSKEKFNTALKMLEAEGYNVYDFDLEQVTNKGQYTKIKVLAPADKTWQEVRDNLDQVQLLDSVMREGGDEVQTYEKPNSIDSSRIMIRYAEEGGKEKDGTIELRRNVEDISLGNSLYAQVRIGVDGERYLKGMAIYGEDGDFPEGVDIIVNSNKHVGTPPEKVFKPMKTVDGKTIDESDAPIDEMNPFGAYIPPEGQRHYQDASGNDQLSVVNKIREEGEWAEYSKSLASQFLSKQPIKLVNQQLDLAYSEKADEFDEIMNYSNDTVKKKLLASFSDDCDAAAVQLKAAALPGQLTQVLLPITSLKDNEIYAPNYEEGTEVILIRYPHGGVFEIPRLTVNNHNAEGDSIITKNAKDAVGISPAAAAQLSGADFDGDTAMVIPLNSKIKVTTKDYYDDLKNFDNKEEYPYHEGMKVMTEKNKGIEMGKITNLITDMTLQGADDDEIVRAVKHSMVVIDAAKHKLDYCQSELDNDIQELRDKYQPKEDPSKPGGGASTIISKASSKVYPNQRERFQIDKDTDPETGKKIFREKEPYIDKNGNVKYYTQESTAMYETEDAFTLVSKMQNPKEISYANYANKMKALGNAARKAYLETKGIKQNKEAAKVYSDEIKSLDEKLSAALKNSPRERVAQMAADKVVKIKIESCPDLDKKDEKKLRQQALSTARTRLGASKSDVQVKITPKEWEAIQAGAVSHTKLMSILNNTDMDVVKQYAMPRGSTISEAKKARIRNLSSSGYSNSQIAQDLGVSLSTVLKYVK